MSEHTPPNNGAPVTVGVLGVDTTLLVGFDIPIGRRHSDPRSPLGPQVSVATQRSRALGHPALRGFLGSSQNIVTVDSPFVPCGICADMIS